VITRLRRAFGITALARFTKSRGSETLTTSYCRRVAGMSLPRNVHGRFLLTIFYRNVAVKIENRKRMGVFDSNECGESGQGDQGASAISRRKVANERVVQGKT
jgi:hypothetical protein